MQLVASVVSRTPFAEAARWLEVRRDGCCSRCGFDAALEALSFAIIATRPSVPSRLPALTTGVGERCAPSADKCASLLCPESPCGAAQREAGQGRQTSRGMPRQDLAHAAAHNAAVGYVFDRRKGHGRLPSCNSCRTRNRGDRAVVAKASQATTHPTQGRRVRAVRVRTRLSRCVVTCHHEDAATKRFVFAAEPPTQLAGARRGGEQMHPRLPKLPRRHPCRAPRPSSSPASGPTHINESYVKPEYADTPPPGVHRRSHRQCGNVENSAAANCGLFRRMERLTALSDVSRAHTFPLAPSTERN